MRLLIIRFLVVIVWGLAGSMALLAQSNSVSGTITDANGAVVAGAQVTIRNSTTGAEYRATSKDDGTFTVTNIPAGSYMVQVGAQGFKTSIVKDVKVGAVNPAAVNISLNVGSVSDPGDLFDSADILYTQNPTIGNTLSGRKIIDLPSVSRSVLDLTVFEPGVSTVGRSRQSTINGLPKGAINITLDGVNIQDNLLKSSDGFFTFIQPKTDAISEVTVATAVLDAQNNGDGAAQIAFVTRSGTNVFSGSLYEYLRNPSLNANYYFNNFSGLPRQRVILNQFGGRIGGPIIKDKAFFFVNYEEYRLPERAMRQRTIFSPSAQSGVFQYGAGQSVNLFTLAAANGQTSTIDPTVGALLAQIRGTTNQGSVFSTADPNLQSFSFVSKGSQVRRFPTMRIDVNLSSKHRFEDAYNYQQFGAGFDFLNNADPAFPGFPNFGSQGSNRFSNSMMLNSTLSASMVNEFRFGFVGGTVRFFPEVTPAQFANQGGVSLALNAANISSATVQRSPQKRNSPVWLLFDHLSWVRGAHSADFGLSFTQFNLFNQSTPGGIVSSVTLGFAAGDPAQAMFNSANFPGASFTNINQAANIYAVLTGRITAESGTAVINESGENGAGYTNLGFLNERDRQREVGLYGMDSWRITPDLTLTGGLRWEIQFPFTPLNNVYSQTTFEQLFGISGVGNLFKPGTLTGSATQFTAVQPGQRAYNTDFGNFAPSIGFAWNPSAKKGALKWLIGDHQSVLRGGYSIAYIREGSAIVGSVLGSNPGGTFNTGVSTGFGTITVPSLLRNGVPPLLAPPASPGFPITGTTGNTANAFLPDLKTGRVHSWSFGVQRAIGRDTVVEARYVGNRAMDMWRQYSINETNVVENGFLNEFKLAQANLAANNAAGGARGNSFAFFGPGTGTSPLPSILGFFNGVPAAQANDPSKYTSNSFRSASFINQLNPALPSAIGFANVILGNPSLFSTNGAIAGIPANFFVVNPGISSVNGGAFLVDNSNRSYYDAAVIEVRRRLSRGLQLDSSYTFSKSLTNYYASSSALAKNFISLHDRTLDRGISPFDINQAFKATFIYDLPFGRGRSFFNDRDSVIDHLVSGWSGTGTVRVQSGTAFSFGNVQLIGISKQELQNSINIRKETNAVFYLPADIIQNTIFAFNGTNPGGRFIAPANLNNPISFPGSTGFPNLVLHGPRFTRFDLGIIKRTRITERVNFEFRAELLNAFNNINFMITTPSTDVGTVGGFSSATFGQTNFAYQDPSGTNDIGGRMIQFVARVNF